MPFRFVHTADIHLDSPLRTLALRNPELAELIASATRQALSAIVDLCLNEAVDALFISGDLYDGDQTSMKTARFLAGELRRLHEAGIQCFVVRGNHDALSKITRELVLPPSVKVFGGRAETTLIQAEGGLEVAVHGVSFASAHAPESLLPRYKAPVEGAANLGLLHTSLSGAQGHDPYAPCSLADLAASGFDYWALGHVHKRSAPQGERTVVMPGMPQGRDINEAGAKSATLVTVGDDRSVRVEERLTSLAQFERVAVNLEGATEWAEVAARITSALEQARETTRSEHLVARLKLEGRTPLAWRIRRDADLLRAEADERASAVGKSWIDKLEIDGLSPPPQAGSSKAPAEADPLTELRRLVSDEVAASPELANEAQSIVEELRGQLPAECRHILGRDEAEFQALLAELVAEGTEDVLARLDGRAPERA
ncbi:MAG TPA: DNA repair exonuclease [Mesorhizobium sp.]|jgi:DNA repair exonuclease SbcCD nuclease subunit|nr:DNA repair exonuclease [Mesorhizobium sp.]